MELDLKRKQEKRRVWLSQRKAKVFAEAREHFHEPVLGLDSGVLLPKGNLAGVKSRQLVATGCDLFFGSTLW